MVQGNRATPETPGLPVARLAFAGALIAVAAVAFWIAGGSKLWQAEQLFPWERERLRLFLWIAGSWLLFLGLITVMAVFWPSGPRTGLRLRFGSRAALLGLVGLMVAFTVAYSWLSIARHMRFNSTAFDLAIHEQAIWNTLQGRFLATSLEVDSALADHFRPFLAVPVLVYALFPSPLTLVSLQALVLASGMIPLYCLSRRRLSSDLMALVLTAVYGLYPAIGFLLRFDFHTEAFAVPAFLAAFDALDQKRWLHASLWLLIPLLCKESMGLTVAAFGLYALIVSRKPTWGGIWLLVGVAVFWFSSFWLIPTLRGESSDTLTRYAWLGDSPRAVLQTLFTTPGVIWEHVTQPRGLLFLVQILLPVGFLSLLAPLELALAGPAFAVNLLSDFYPQMTIYFQYTVPIIPFVFISAVFGMARLRSVMRADWAWKTVGLTLGMFSLAIFFVDNPCGEHPLLPSLWDEIGNADAVRLALQTVPPEGSVVTSNSYGPHLAQRPELYIIGIPSQREAPTEPDIVFINLRDLRFVPCEQYHSYLLQLDPAGYGVTFRTDGVLVIQRNKGSVDEFRDLVLDWNECAG